VNEYVFTQKFNFRDDLSISFNILNYSNNSNKNITFSNTNVELGEISPFENSDFSYNIKTIISKDNYNGFVDTSKSFLEFVSNEIIFEPIREIKLNKLERENQSTTNSSNRWILVDGKNPTNYDVQIISIDLFKTTPVTNNQFLSDENLIKTFSNVNLTPAQKFYFSYNDLNSTDSNIYWIDSQFSILYNISLNIKINYIKNSESSSGGPTGEYNNEKLKLLKITKSSDKEIIEVNDEIEFKINIQNPNYFSVKNLSILDSKSSYFSYMDDLKFSKDEILPFENIEIKYNAIFNKKSSNDLIFISPARLEYSNEIIYSNFFTLIQKQENESSQLILEKRIEPLENDDIRIFIKVSNIGNVKVDNIKIVESDLDENSNSFKSWIIPNLNPGENWQTFYDVKFENASYFIPEIFVEGEVKVYKTIILNNKINNSIYFTEESPYVTVLVGFAIMLLVSDVLF